MNTTLRLNPKILTSAIALTLGVAAFSMPATVQAIPVTDMGNTMQNLMNQLRAHADAVKAQVTRVKELKTAIETKVEIVREGLKYGNEVFDDLQSPISDLMELYNDSKKLARSIGDIDKEYRQRYKGYGDYMKDMLGNADPYSTSNKHGRFSSVGARPDSRPDRKKSDGSDNSASSSQKEKEAQQEEQWHGETNDMVVRALEAASIPTSVFDKDSDALNKLKKLSLDAKGRMQALQAGNELAGMMVEQLMRLNVLVSEQIKFQAGKEAQNNERRAKSSVKINIIQGDPPKRNGSVGFRTR